MRFAHALAAIVTLAGSAQAAAPESSIPQRIAADEVTAWLDEVFTPMLAQRRYAGLAVVAVQDGAVLFIKGYGFADAARRTPMAPDRTRLRIGSITKTMTATLILQLLDEGRIRSLDDPANEYLRRYQLPNDRGVPITLRHLLTHTAGFEALLLGLGTERAAKAPADASYIRQVMPRQVRAPGGRPIYSNFAFQTLGAVVEDLTGQTMAEALAQRLLRPLGMSDSALPYGLDPSPDLGQPYAFFPNGDLQIVPYVPMHPFSGSTGGVEATAADMARYMVAQLDEDGGPGEPILPSPLLREMHRRQAGANPSVPGLGLGIFVGDRAGTAVLSHPGGWPGFHSLMTLLPQQQLGLFMSAMAEAPVPGAGESFWGSARLQPTATPAVGPALNLGDLYEIREAFLDRFVGAREPSFVALDARPVIGSYLDAVRSHSSPESVLGLFGNPSVVLARGSAIEVDGNGPYYAIGPVSFARKSVQSGPPASGPGRYAFEPAPTGKTLYMIDATGSSVSERIAAIESPRLWRRYAIVAGLLCLSAVLLVRKSASSVWSRIATWLPLGILSCLILQALVVFIGFEPGRSLFFDLLAGRSQRFAALVALGDLMLIGVLATIAAAIAAWRFRFWGSGARGLAMRVHFSIIAVAAAGLVPILYSLNLIGLPGILDGP